MFRYCLLSILVLSPLALAGDADQGNCVDAAKAITICAEGTVVTHVSIKGRRRYHTLNLQNYTAIAPDALKDLNRHFSLTLDLGDPETCEPRAFDLTPESFNGICSRLENVYISCWDVPKDSDIFKNCRRMHRVSLERSGMTEIPKKMLSNMTEWGGLIFEGHQVKSLDHDSFSGVAPNVERMFLMDGPLETIEGRPFRKFGKLTILSLKNNKITELKPGIFIGLEKLEKLTVEGNQIEKIGRNVFTSDLQELKGVDFRNNRIKQIEWGVFFGLPISGLFLTNNSLETLPEGALEGIKGLKTLHLSGNKFSVIPSHYFSKLKDLKWLKMNYGALSKIEPFGLEGPKYSSIEIEHNLNLEELVTDAFNGVTGSVVLLKLEHNNIKVVQENAFRDSDLSSVYLWGNPITNQNTTGWGVGERTSVYFRDLFG